MAGTFVRDPKMRYIVPVLCALFACCAVLAEDDVSNRAETKALLKTDPSKTYDLKDTAGAGFKLTERRDERWALYTLADKDGKQLKLVLARIVPVQAIYKNEDFKVLVKEASGNTPAVYETRTRLVCVKPESVQYDYSSNMSFSEDNKRVTVGDSAYTIKKVEERQRLRKKPLSPETRQ
jgi:hypothetical protein